MRSRRNSHELFLKVRTIWLWDFTQNEPVSMLGQNIPDRFQRV